MGTRHTAGIRNEGTAMEQDRNKSLFESIPVPRAVRIMALPTIISQLIVLIYNMADTFYLGRTNNPFMVAGVSLILPVFNICLSLAGLAGIGGGALISRLLGAGDSKEAEKVSAFSLRLAVITTALFSAGMLLFMDPVLGLLGASGNTRAYAAQYSFCVIVLGGIPTVLSNVMANLLRSVGESGKAGFGIAMGGLGSDAAIEAADIVLMDDKPSKLAIGMRVAKKTLKIAKENTFFSIFIKVLVLLLAVVGLATMWMAVLADVGVMVLAVLNSTRALKG